MPDLPKQISSTVLGLLYHLAGIMASTFYLEELVHRLLKEVLFNMHITRGTFILLTEEGKIYEVMHQGYTATPEFDENEIKMLFDERKTLFVKELNDDFLKDIMHKLKVSVVVHLHTETENVGIFLVGEKLKGEYTAYDIQVLEILAPEAAVAIQNARRFEEIRRFNITLEQEINRATDDLRKSNEEIYKKNVELAKLGKRLSDANEKLKTLDKLKDEFLSLASHELRTPMTAIKSYLWMVLQGEGGIVSEKQSEYLNRAYNSTSHLITLVNEMLDVSRIESGRITLNIAATKLGELIDDVVAEITPRATELEIEISVIPYHTSISPIMADYDKIKEVLINLVGNALKFTPRKGKITISLLQKDGFVETTVTDTGVGLKSEDVPKLFQKFSMVGGVEHKALNQQGTGLGLYIAKSIIELHGGKIWVKSDGIGKGTSFTFSLPIVKLPS